MISGTLARDILNSIFLIFEENRRDSEVMRGKVINQAKDEFPTLQLMPDTGQDDDGGSTGLFKEARRRREPHRRENWCST